MSTRSNPKLDALQAIYLAFSLLVEFKRILGAVYTWMKRGKLIAPARFAGALFALLKS